MGFKFLCAAEQTLSFESINREQYSHLLTENELIYDFSISQPECETIKNVKETKKYHPKTNKQETKTKTKTKNNQIHF